jgi:glycosyltransferase involved in cell wall biosynthesis
MGKKIIIIGGIPPPFIGTTARIQLLINNSIFRNKVDFDLFDIIDRRSSDNMGKFEYKNILLGLKHSAGLLFKLLREKFDIAFLSIAQNKWAFIRDSILILICKIFGLKVIVHLDGGHFKEFYTNQNEKLKKYIKYVCYKIDFGILLGESLRYNFEGLIKNNVVIHAGVPIIGIGDRNKSIKRILFLSSLFRSKGYLDVLKAIPFVIKELPNIEFVFVGREGIGPDDTPNYDIKMERDKIIKENDIEKYIKLLGPLYYKERDDEFRKADIFVFPSYYIYEGMPAVVLQAMSAGLPIICTNFPGSEDLIKDRITGFIIDKHSPLQIAEKILLLLDDEQLRMKMGEINLDIIKTGYNLEKHVIKTIEVLIN